MFGMLDYRAFKLFWLITRPLWLISRIGDLGSIVVAIMLSASLDYSVPVRIVIAYAILFGVHTILYIVLKILLWFVREGFFWLVDVVPAKADSVAEAKAMVRLGPISWLDKKFLNDIGNWTEDDTKQVSSLVNWRARLFFAETERVCKRAERWQKIYKDTGRQPSDFTAEERLKVVSDLEPSWYEKAIVDP